MLLHHGMIHQDMHYNKNCLWVGESLLEESFLDSVFGGHGRSYPE